MPFSSTIDEVTGRTVGVATLLSPYKLHVMRSIIQPFDDGFGHFRLIWNYAFFYYFFITMSIITLPLTCSRLQNSICNDHDKK